MVAIVGIAIAGLLRNAVVCGLHSVVVQSTVGRFGENPMVAAQSQSEVGRRIKSAVVVQPQSSRRKEK